MNLPVDHDYEIEKQGHPENFEPVPSELFCPNDGSRLMEATRANGPDDYDMFAYCKNCDYITE